METFEVDASLACQSEMIKNLIDGGCGHIPYVPLPLVNNNTLIKVIEYWNRHKDDSDGSSSSPDDDLKKKKKSDAAEFVKMSRDELFDLIVAANYLIVKPLYKLLVQVVADNIKKMSVEECREYMREPNDFTTPEEEQEMREKFSWAFDK